MTTLTRKKKIHRDIYQILSISGIPSQYWEKVLTKLTNYTYNEVIRAETMIRPIPIHNQIDIGLRNG